MRVRVLAARRDLRAGLEALVVDLAAAHRAAAVRAVVEARQRVLHPAALQLDGAGQALGRPEQSLGSDRHGREGEERDQRPGPERKRWKLAVVKS